jgi:SAM-dependent methyltransferase
MSAPELTEMRARYAALDWPVTERTRWKDELIDSYWDMRYFRGDTPYVWQYRETERASRLKYFIYLRYVLERDKHSLVERLGEDGMFGCWTYRFPGYPPFSRDLLDSVNELSFLDDELSFLSASGMRVLDIGAGYGRLAHRSIEAASGITDYACIDAIPESTYLSSYHLAFRGLMPPARVLQLPDVRTLEPGSFDIAFNVHSFSEIPHRAIAWWLEEIERLRIPKLFIVPNEREGFLSLEPDGSRKDFGSLITSAGYELVAERAAFTDEAVAELMQTYDRYYLFARAQ